MKREKEMPGKSKGYIQGFRQRRVKERRVKCVREDAGVKSLNQERARGMEGKRRGNVERLGEVG